MLPQSHNLCREVNGKRCENKKIIQVKVHVGIFVKDFWVSGVLLPSYYHTNQSEKAKYALLHY